MNERSMWLGYSLGMITSGLIVIIAVINNYYIQELSSNHSLHIANIYKPSVIDYFVVGGLLTIFGFVVILLLNRVYSTSPVEEV